MTFTNELTGRELHNEPLSLPQLDYIAFQNFDIEEELPKELYLNTTYTLLSNDMPGIDETENQWRYRLQDPSLFEKDSFRTKEFGKGVSAILGKKKNTGKWEIQALRFDKDKFKTRKEVENWLKEHEYKSLITLHSNIISKSYIQDTNKIEFIGVTSDITGGTGIDENKLPDIVAKHNQMIQRWKQGDMTAKPILITDKFDHDIRSLKDVIGYVDKLDAVEFISPIDGRKHKGIKVSAEVEPTYRSKFDLIKQFSISFIPKSISKVKDNNKVFSDIDIQHFAVTPQPVDENAVILSYSLISSDGLDDISLSLRGDVNMRKSKKIKDEDENRDEDKSIEDEDREDKKENKTDTELEDREENKEEDKTDDEDEDEEDEDKDKKKTKKKDKDKKEDTEEEKTDEDEEKEDKSAIQIKELQEMNAKLLQEKKALEDQILKSKITMQIDGFLVNGNITPVQKSHIAEFLYKAYNVGLYDDAVKLISTFKSVDKSQVIPDGSYIQTETGQITNPEQVMALLPPEFKSLITVQNTGQENNKKR